MIQSAYRRMLSYRAYERKKLIRISDRRREAAIKIQCMVLRWRSHQLTTKLRERVFTYRRNQACTR